MGAAPTERSAPRGAGRVRSFVAIELAAPTRAAVEAYLARLRQSGADVAWTRPENLHLTLKFLGDVEPGRLAALTRRLATVATAQAPFVLTVAGIGAFPSLTRPRVLWVGARAPEIEPLATEVDRACASEGFAREARAFHPHVTLGRVRGGRRPGRGGTATTAVADRCAADRERVFGESPATALVVFGSHLGRDGARHEALARLCLGGAPG